MKNYSAGAPRGRSATNGWSGARSPADTGRRSGAVALSSTHDWVYVHRSPKTWGGTGPNPLCGTRCRVLVTGPGPGPHNRLVETADGRLLVVTEWAVEPDTTARARSALAHAAQMTLL